MIRSKYRGFEYFVIMPREFGTYPLSLLGYIKIPSKNPLYGKDYSEVEIGYQPHGCFTFSGYRAKIGPGWYLGWDYAHGDDFVEGVTAWGRMWTPEEVVLECKNVIDAITETQGKAKKV